MSAELEMMHEENERLRRHIATLNAHCTKLEAALDVALEALERLHGIVDTKKGGEAIAKLKEVRK